MNVKNLVLGVGIFLVFLFMLHYGIQTFYPSPQYDDFCKATEPYYGKTYPGVLEANCSFSRELYDQEKACYAEQGQPVYEYNDRGCAVSVSECNTCNQEYNDATKAHASVVFIIALIVGIITLLIGYGVLSVEPVGSALMASGVGAIFYGAMQNWQNLSNIWRFVLLIVALVLLIWIALRINSGKKKSWMFWK